MVHADGPIRRQVKGAGDLADVVAIRLRGDAGHTQEDGGSRLAERMGYLRSPGGLAAGFWWLVKGVTRLEYDWLLACEIDPGKTPAASAEPWQLHKLASPAEDAAAPPRLLAQLERHTWTTVAGHVAVDCDTLTTRGENGEPGWSRHQWSDSATT